MIKKYQDVLFVFYASTNTNHAVCGSVRGVQHLCITN